MSLNKRNFLKSTVIAAVVLTSQAAIAENKPMPAVTSQGITSAGLFTASELPGQLDESANQVKEADALNREIKRRQYQELKQKMFEAGSPSIAFTR